MQLGTQLERLLRQLTGPSARPSNSLTLLHCTKDAEIARTLLEGYRGDAVDVLKATDSMGRTALHIAVMDQNAELVKVLLEFGADPALADKTGISEHARECVAIVARMSEILTNAGAVDDDATMNDLAVNARMASCIWLLPAGRTAIHYALKPDIMRALIAAGADKTALSEHGLQLRHFVAAYDAVVACMPTCKVVTDTELRETMQLLQ